MNKYYQLTQIERTANLNIYGDITSWPWMESDVSAYNLSKELAELDVDQINVYINSYGGEVAEGLAIYNSLRNHQAKVTTICDGFACSIASVIFMAGEKRIMNESSLLMIHNAWTYAAGNAEELRKQAEDLEKITQASVAAYLSKVTIEEKKVKELMDNESWILPEDALSWGFATEVKKNTEETIPSQSARSMVFNKLTKKESTNAEEIANLIVQKLQKEKQIEQPEPKPTKSLTQTLAGFFNTKEETE